MIALLASFLLSRNPALAPAHARRLAKAGLVVVGVLLLVAGFGVWLWMHDSGVIEADRSASRAEAVSRAREADERAHGAAQAITDDVRASNQSAAEAAAQSDDPLKAGLDDLRNRQR